MSPELPMKLRWSAAKPSRNKQYTSLLHLSSDAAATPWKANNRSTQQQIARLIRGIGRAIVFKAVPARHG